MRTSYKEALARAKGPVSKWPGRGEGSRLEPEAWPLLAPRFRLHPGETVFTIGSCFARNIERHLEILGFDVPAGRFRVPAGEMPDGTGVGLLNKYTPHSMRDEIAWAARVAREGAGESLLAQSLFEVEGGRCIDLGLAGFVPVTRERALERRREIAALYQRCFDADVVIMTLGLVEAWHDAKRGAYIQQAPNAAMLRHDRGRWQFEVLSYEDALQSTREAIELLDRTGRPGKRILLTTSPVPMARTFSGDDVLVANMHSKSVLRAVCGALARTWPNVDYAPAYESVMLSRTPAVWKDDLIHVTTEFVGKVVERVLAAYVDDTARLPDVPLEARVARIGQARRPSTRLGQARAAGDATRFREVPHGVVIFAPDASAHGVAYGPLDLSAYRSFAALLELSQDAEAAEVTLEIREPGSSTACFSAATRVAGDVASWQLPLPALPTAATVTLHVRASSRRAGAKQVPRVRIINPRFFAERGGDA